MGGPMRGGHSASINAENDLILNSHMLAKFKKRIEKQNEFKNWLKPKESIPRETKINEEQIGETIGNLIDYVDVFQRAIRNMTTDVEIPSNITNGLL